MAIERVVIDGSAAINAVLVADAFGGWSGLRLTAPSLIWSEAASGVSQLRWRGEITDQEASDALRRLLAAPIDPVSSSDLILDAIVLARQLGWAKTYDAEYVALARRLDAPLLTVDAKLASAVRAHVRVLSPADIA